MLVHKGVVNEIDYMRVSVSESSLLTYDGRAVVWVNGVAWALKPEVHAQRLAEALEAQRLINEQTAKEEKVTPKKSILPQGCPKIIDGNLCGGHLKFKNVCPASALGKQGVYKIATCEVCDNVFVVSHKPGIFSEVGNV